MIPLERIERASSSRGSSRKRVRGWYGLGSIKSMSICCGSPAVTEGRVAGGLTCCGGSGSRIRALRPRPSAFLVIGNDLLGKLDVALGSSAVYIVENDWFSVAGCLGSRTFLGITVEKTCA